MDVLYTCGLLAAANEQRHGFIKLRGAQADREVRKMVAAGLVTASFSEDKEGLFTSINRVRRAGQTFLQAKKEVRTLDEVRPVLALTAAQTITLSKWRERLG